MAHTPPYGPHVDRDNLPKIPVMLPNGHPRDDQKYKAPNKEDVLGTHYIR